MDFDQAVMAHTAWKTTLSEYLEKPDGSIKAADLEGDIHCPLGRWIYGEGRKFSSLHEYAVLKKEHAAFHRAAAEVIKKVDAGEPVSEDIALGAQSQFGRTSRAVIGAIVSIKSEVARQERGK